MLGDGNETADSGIANVLPMSNNAEQCIIYSNKRDIPRYEQKLKILSKDRKRLKIPSQHLNYLK